MANRPFTSRRFDSWGGLNAAARRAVKVNKYRTMLVDDLASFATGNIIFSSNPLSNATLTLGGTVVTFGPAGGNVHIAGSLTDTLANLLAFLNASGNVNLIKCTYVVSGSGLFIRYKTAGIKTFTLAASAATVSGATLKLNQIQKRIAIT
jgi:hypothetical protein